MRFTELERSLLSLAAALVARLDLIEQGDDLADTIAERSCASCEKALIEAQSRHAEEVNGLTDEVIELRKSLRAMVEFICEIRPASYTSTNPEAIAGSLVFLNLWQQMKAEKDVMDELAEDINAEAAQDETLRFSPEDRIVPTEAGAKAVSE
jgi:CII-binding regulator of phage lambda lysogenization HflD